MKFALIIASTLLLTTTAHAEGVPTLQSANGVIVKSLASFDTFEIDVGQASNCAVQTYISSCDLTNASATIMTSEGTEESVVLDRYFHDRTRIGDINYETWSYRGIWSKTIDGLTFSETASIRFIERSDRPGEYFGFFKIENLGLTHQLKARITK